MITSREDFLMTLLHCGSLDLKLIDDVNYDWCDILDDTLLEGDIERLKINNVMRAVFSYGLLQIKDAIEDRVAHLKGVAETKGLKGKQAEELRALQVLNVDDDFESFHNCLDTNIWCEKHGDIYKKYMSKALDDFAEGTGFEIVINEG